MEQLAAFIEGGFADFTEYCVYPKSVHSFDGKACFMVDRGSKDYFIAEDGLGFIGSRFTANGKTWTKCELSHENAVIMRKLFPFTAPSAVLKNDRTFGVGDRLGLATEGHIRVFEEYDAFPILAQQSMRELKFTNRTFGDVLDCVSFAVFRDNYTRGFGADGDHLKTPEEVSDALAYGYTMITLDCSEHIRGDVAMMTPEEIHAIYKSNTALEKKYVGRTFDVNGYKIAFDSNSFKKMCLIYADAIDFAADIYCRFFKGREKDLDFEISIDETDTATDPAQHFFIAKELMDRGVYPTTIAPRFCGEFQKGIDYIGDISQFEDEFKVHAAIANHFGYKLSVHSGSDKFSVFNIIGKYTNGRFHLKTAGTNWLEAIKIVAQYNPSLYRACHQYALDTAFEEAKKYYHVTTDLTKICPLDQLCDDELVSLFENRDARQLIHITYGFILNNPTFRGALFDTWRSHREEYAQALNLHIGKHLRLMYEGFSS